MVLDIYNDPTAQLNVKEQSQGICLKNARMVSGGL